ncbi:hypothetical protein H0A36_23930 [Endozoicomonas sp. SM1973]|uniref:Bro-N domain-containing protein n=1 Tax=Spartinivicinus marinus TaxID=2994442 RepID=A0A853IGD7_9GAMM|nr:MULTISPECIES: BRO family protein [Spartinivicinus]MCX4027677.1 BRO family protein [Spartinivicinus marinus]NYZ69074.1 hypothetical protein [Spartinivicinus marinus]
MATLNASTPFQLVPNPYHIVPNPFEYNRAKIRTALHHSGEIWFCAKDVCEAVGLRWQGVGKSLRNIPAEWISIASLPNGDFQQDMYIICEPALYRLVFRSNKSLAVDFTNWVCCEIIPTIRKQGCYDQVSQQDQVKITKTIVKLVKELSHTQDAFIFDLLKRRLTSLCNCLGEPMPNLELLGQNRNQLGLGV